MFKVSSACAIMVVNTAVVGLVIFALYFTHNLWSFLGLIGMMSTKAASVNTKCPKCGHAFTGYATEEDKNAS